MPTALPPIHHTHNMLSLALHIESQMESENVSPSWTNRNATRFRSSYSSCRKLKKKYERICRTVYKRLIDYTECERLIGAKNPLYDGGDLYPWTNNDSLIDWSVVNYNTDDGIGGGVGNGTSSPTKQTMPVLPPFELYQVGGCLRI